MTTSTSTTPRWNRDTWAKQALSISQFPHTDPQVILVKETSLSLTRACVRVKSPQAFIENLLYAQHQEVLGTQLLSLVPTVFPESVIMPHAFHSPHCPPGAMAQSRSTVDYWLEPAWATDGPQTDSSTAEGSSPPLPSKRLRANSTSVSGSLFRASLLCFITSCLLLRLWTQTKCQDRDKVTGNPAACAGPTFVLLDICSLCLEMTGKQCHIAQRSFASCSVRY